MEMLQFLSSWCVGISMEGRKDISMAQIWKDQVLTVPELQ